MLSSTPGMSIIFKDFLVGLITLFLQGLNPATVIVGSANYNGCAAVTPLPSASVSSFFPVQINGELICAAVINLSFFPFAELRKGCKQVLPGSL